MEKYLVSYQYHNGDCGNKSGDLASLKHFAKEHRQHFKSFTFFKILPMVGSGVTRDLEPIEVTL